MAAGETADDLVRTHGSTPITELPAEWPDDYRRLVERRIELIESDPNIRLIEQPEYKRRWNTEPWESQLERALRDWLLDRLESLLRLRRPDERRGQAHGPTRHRADLRRQAGRHRPSGPGFPPGRRALPRRSRVRRGAAGRRAGRGRERAAAADPPLQAVGPAQARGVGKDLGPSAPGGRDRRPHEAPQGPSRSPVRSWMPRRSRRSRSARSPSRPSTRAPTS